MTLWIHVKGRFFWGGVPYIYIYIYVYVFSTSYFMSEFTQFTAPAMIFDCFCMSQAAYCCISRMAPPRDTERGAMRVFQLHFGRRGVYSFSI